MGLSDFPGPQRRAALQPLAFSSVCTTQLSAIHEDRYAETGTQMIGISVGSRHAQRVFAEQLGLKDTALLADFEPKGEVARRYGAHLEGPGISKRATFVIDRDGVVRSAIVKEPGDIPDEDEYFRTLSTCNA